VESSELACDRSVSEAGNYFAATVIGFITNDSVHWQIDAEFEPSELAESWIGLWFGCCGRRP